MTKNPWGSLSPEQEALAREQANAEQRPRPSAPRVAPPAPPPPRTHEEAQARKQAAFDTYLADYVGSVLTGQRPDPKVPPLPRSPMKPLVNGVRQPRDPGPPRDPRRPK